MNDTTTIDTERERLSRQRELLASKLVEVKDLLSKADARLREDPQNRKRWMSVVENLEASLTEVKGRLEGTETELRLLESRGIPLNAAPLATSARSDQVCGVYKTLTQMPMDQLTRLTLEELSRADGQCRLEQGPEDQRTQALARIEMANQLRAAAPERDEVDLPSSRTQLALRAAISKIQTGRIETMTADEVRMTVSCYELMVRRVNPTPSDLRLKRILSGAITILQKRQADLAQD